MEKSKVEKSVIILLTNGTQVSLKEIPSFSKMREYIGGYLEMVKVLPLETLWVSRDSLTYMIVDAEGRLKNLPRNIEATRIYHNLTKRQFPGVENPFAKAKEEFLRSFPKGVYISSYYYEEGDPYIAGDVIYFYGYTCKELERIWEREKNG